MDQVAAARMDEEQRFLFATACEAARTAGGVLRDLYGKPHEIHLKGAVNLVTEADLASEAVIVALLEEKTPHIKVMTEELHSSHTHEHKERLWVVDPLDGTTNFAHDFPFFAVSIALLDQGQPLVGAVYAPLSDELFCAAAGAGAWRNGEKIRVSETSHPIEALVGTGFPYNRSECLSEIVQQLEQVLAKVRDLRRAGAAALDLAYVACGRLDGFYERELQPWDSAAGWLLVREAGGETTDFSGNAYSPFIPEILATNGVLHPALLALL